MKTIFSLTLTAAVVITAAGSLSPAYAGGSAASKFIGKFVSATALVSDSAGTSHGLFGKKKKKSSESTNTGTNTGSTNGTNTGGGENDKEGGLSFQDAFRQAQGEKTSTTEEVSGEQARMNQYAESIRNGNTGRVIDDEFCHQPGVSC